MRSRSLALLAFATLAFPSLTTAACAVDGTSGGDVGTAVTGSSALTSQTNGATSYPSIVSVGSHTQVHGYCSRQLGCYYEEVYDVTVQELATSPNGGGILPKQSIAVPGESSTVGTGVVRVADLDGDGMSDLVFWTRGGIDVAWGQVDPTGEQLFSSSTQNVYTGSSFYGASANLVGDVNGDGLPELIAWSPSGIDLIYGKAGRAFSAATPLPSPVPAPGNVASLVEDLDFDGQVDFISWGTSGVTVAMSKGYWLQAPSLWSSHVTPGNEVNLAFPAGYVGRGIGPQGQRYEWAQLVGWGSTGLFETYTTQKLPGFQTTYSYPSPPSPGTTASFALDVNADDILDLVAVNASNVKVALGNTSFGLNASEQWSGVAVAGGSLGTFGGRTSR